jgi:glycosyltransferase involved in cell wall biosynthesis
MAGPLTVVEVTGRLGIGGVETHVSNLARGLLSRGHRVVIVTQDPGVGGDEAKAAGAELVTVPFKNGALPNLIETLKPLDADIVHAHNYRAARVGAPLARALNLHYVMSVHGPRPWWKRAVFGGWSRTVLTASEADRDGVLGPFGVSNGRVIVGFYGVDTDRFTPGLDASSLRATWGVDGAPVILNVSRFSRRKVLPGLALLAALPLVRLRIPGVKLVLVGEGSRLERVVSEADRLNRALGECVVVVSGPRRDVPQVMNAGSVVVATATTAVESLASGAPTAAYGRTGYFGIVTPENYEEARAACFGDHGPDRAAATTEEVADDLVSLLSDMPAARREARRIRTIIQERYGVDRMVDQIEGVYRRLLEQPAAMTW